MNWNFNQVMVVYVKLNHSSYGCFAQWNGHVFFWGFFSYNYYGFEHKALQIQP